ncbi:MAG: dipeptidase, partial [Melioribacteraceae bacterium]|nr:dipeptidase [Melioribacteraceae bacterium]
DGGNGRGLMELNSSSQIGLAKISSSDATDLELIFTKFSFVPDTLTVSVIGGEVYNSTLETIHSHAVMVDLHNDILERIFMVDPNYHLGDYNTKFETDIPRLKIGGVDIQLFVAWIHPSVYEGRYFETTIEMIDRLKYEASLNSGDLIQTFDYTTSMSAIESNKIAAVMCVEGGHSIENSIDKLITLYDAGMRYMTITWNNSLDWAISAQDSRSATVGLNEFGRGVIRKMDSLGVIIDISHTGIKTIQDILEVSNNPIIATHSGARAIQNHYRNLYNYQIEAIANSGGVIGVVFYPPFLGDPDNNGKIDISDVIIHIDHIVNLVGVDYVAIGSDFDGTGGNLPVGLDDVTKFPDLTYALLEHGYSQSEVEKILGGNFLRVFKEVCGE